MQLDSDSEHKNNFTVPPPTFVNFCDSHKTKFQTVTAIEKWQMNHKLIRNYCELQQELGAQNNSTTIHTAN